MPKFKKGETSNEIINKKKAITKSILMKSELLDKINTYSDIASSLKIKANSISQAVVHNWNDEQLGIISYSRNAAHSEHNKHALETLIKSIKNANQRLTNVAKKQGEIKSLSRLSEEAVQDLKNDNENLRVALAEVYRAYMQLLDHYHEDKEVDEALRNLIKDQARVLGKNRVWRIK